MQGQIQSIVRGCAIQRQFGMVKACQTEVGSVSSVLEERDSQERRTGRKYFSV